MKETHKITKKYYDNVSKWRSNGFWEGWVGEISKRRVLPGIKALNFKDGDKYLDVGCGPGFNIDLVLKNNPEKNIGAYGIDISNNNIETAKKKVKAEFRTGVVEKLPYKDEIFDKITYFHVIEHVTDPVKSLQEISRVLKNEGEICFSFQNKYGLENLLMGLSKKMIFLFGGDKAGFSKPKGVLDIRRSIFQIRKMCKKAGLKVVKTKGCIVMLPSVAWRIKFLRKPALFLSDILEKLPVVKYASSYMCLKAIKNQ